MPARLEILLLLVCIPFAGISAQDRGRLPLIPKDTTIENERNNQLFVFIGEKITMEELPQEQGAMDMGYLAKYKVLQRVYGDYNGDTIEFRVYDHYGAPLFAAYKNVMLFVSGYEGKYYHEKYQYFDVYKTRSGRWASSYKELDYGHQYNKNTLVKPEIIDFAEEVSYPTKLKYANGDEMTMSYPEPYYKTVGDKAIAVYGNYVEELFRLKKEGVLAARQLFEDKHKDDPVEDVKLEEVFAAPDKNDRKFMSSWKSFAQSIRKNDRKKIKAAILDSLWVNDSLMTSAGFIENYLTTPFRRNLVPVSGDSFHITYRWVAADTSGILPCAQQRIIKRIREYGFRTVQVADPKSGQNAWSLYALFIETRQGYKLYGWYNSGSKE